MEVDKVESLWTLALKSLLVSLKSSTDQIKDQIGRNYRKSINFDAEFIDLDWHTFSSANDFILNSSDVQALIEYHKPHREYLCSVKRIEDCRTLLKREDIFPAYNKFHNLIYWLCFENSETNQLMFQPNIDVIDRTIYAYLEKFNIRLLKCKIVELEINCNEEDKLTLSSEQTKDIFARITNVEDLRFWMVPFSRAEEILKKNIMTEIIPQFKLKALNISLYWASQSADLFELCALIDNSPKFLERLEISFRRDQDAFTGRDVTYLMESLKKLKRLKVLNLDLLGVRYNDRAFENFFVHDKISVKKMKLWIKDYALLKVIHKCFNVTQTLVISSNGITKLIEMTDLQKSILESSLLSTSVFQNVTTLSIGHVDPLPIRMVTIWNIFPNLREFTSFALTIEGEDYNEFPTVHKLEKLTVYFGRISPELFCKMPNLKDFILFEDRLSKLINNIKPFLPPNCKLSTTTVCKIRCFEEKPILPLPGQL